MDGAAAENVLRSNTAPRRGDRFELASADDEPEIARILRENPMEGAIRLSMEHVASSNSRSKAPDVRPGLRADIHQTLVGRRDNGTGFGVAERFVRRAYINGEIAPLGYLGTLRLDRDYRNNPRTLIRGYEKLRELHDADRACPFYLTSIMSDNTPARRFLEANVRGMPAYRFLTDYVTLVLPVPRGVASSTGISAEHATDDTLPEIANLLKDDAAGNQFAPAHDLNQLPRGLSIADFRVLRSVNQLSVCGAVWDQSAFRLTVVRGYSPTFARLRPVINLIASISGRPRLPDVGQPIRLGYLSHLAARNPDPITLLPLFQSLVGRARASGLDYLAVGFSADNPLLLPFVRRHFTARELRSRLYVVYWPDGKGAVEALDGRPIRPEVGLL